MEERETPRPPTDRDARTGRSAAANRIRHQGQWVEEQLRIARERGDFDDLPGLGKPIEGLGEAHDPDWWLKRLVEREHISVLPPALAIRREDAALDAVLDRISVEREVRREVEEFNARVRSARIQPLGGPPMVTSERDVEAEVARWAERRRVRRRAGSAPAAGAGRAGQGDRAQGDRPDSGDPAPRRRRGWLRRRHHPEG
ncbi:DnaJ family domain-containing protein [Nocardioides donggukensis]|uniref:DUF1992 domain-containing protein n=1 Tax=Nocardioides donggukensis TaxID=2774019 RepID=A0A927K1D5_9ACTN|nr:DUF1992 domain-containing protein [Nocardioides donggukensis]MBD8868209.1 DUF1992 domain-containing protein [Nocardioides donggukensis]